MRQLRLLLSLGTILSLAAGAANAEMFPPNAAGSNQSPSGTGMQTLTSGFQEVGSIYGASQGQQYSPTNASYGASPFSTPNPGTVNMRIDLQVVGLGQVGWWTGMNGNGYAGATGTGSASPVGNKQNPYGIQGYARFDWAVDGMTKAGIRYGAFTEIREASPVSVQASPTSSGSSTADSGGATSNPTGDTLYIRNACLYIGTDAIGVAKIGQGGCVDVQAGFEIGLNDEFDAAGWDGNAGTLFPGSVSPTWPWSDGGNLYMPAEVAYFSPVIAGFDGGISFAPSANQMFTNSACGSITGFASNAGCNAQSASNAPSDIARWTNRLEIALRYRNAWGPVGLAVSGIWAVSGQVQPGPFAPTTGSGAIRYNATNTGNIGAEISINKYLAIGANTLFGAYNGSGGLQNKPIGQQTSTTTSIAWVAGARYTIISMPLTIGASYFNFKFQGQPGLPGPRVSQGIDVGADYGLGPGMVILAEYLWGQNYQGGYNFLTGACSAGATTCSSSTAAGANNQVQVQTFLMGLALKF
jgi:hypothetical protein